MTAFRALEDTERPRLRTATFLSYVLPDGWRMLPDAIFCMPQVNPRYTSRAPVISCRISPNHIPNRNNDARALPANAES